MRSILYFFLLLFQTVSYASSSISTGQNDFLSPDDAFKVSFSYPSNNQLLVTWDIEKDYYLYVGMINFSLINNVNKNNILKVELPKGMKKIDEFFGEVDIYKGKGNGTILGLFPKLPITIGNSAELKSFI